VVAVVAVETQLVQVLLFRVYMVAVEQGVESQLLVLLLLVLRAVKE
jgi:hypothetical protein